MNLFTSQQAPAILAVILSVIGFYISTVVAEIRSQPVVTYRFSQSADGTAELRLKNVSLAQVVADARFEIACTDGREDCLMAQPSGGYAVLDRTPPVSPTNVTLEASPREAAIRANLVPGAVVALAVRQAPTANAVPLEFYYTASKTAPEALLLFDARSLTALFVDNYFTLMLVVFLVAAAALTLVIVVPPLVALRTRKTGPEDPGQPAPPEG
ncbi:hypothetical protein PVW46_28480 [Mameliella sp. AT18]|uniref:hypothetical protein n=1 Tax=Mameliella sp. AT18 TaxID=3028385 RepID=UPI000840FE1C|nr:hypothetical protein [Mameliella sp. AT18]MDD9733860.1 hypothetical protein [Mameliella sp. AT18]ODM45736.1 hypothetical protein A9320_09640 [Ruegeria sp. PBVC088]